MKFFSKELLKDPSNISPIAPHNILPKQILQHQAAKCANINQFQQCLRLKLLFFSPISMDINKNVQLARIENRLNQPKWLTYLQQLPFGKLS